MNKKIVIGVMICIILFIGALAMSALNPSDYAEQTPQAATTTSSQTSGTATSTQVAQYTLADVALHASPSDCWSVIDSSVYNFTDYIGKHPGGARAVTKLCGKDGSREYNSEHGGQKRPTETLLRYKIGTLK
jgi:cytochrome b involved in lipid metabolism